MIETTPSIHLAKRKAHEFEGLLPQEARSIHRNGWPGFGGTWKPRRNRLGPGLGAISYDSAAQQIERPPQIRRLLPFVAEWMDPIHPRYQCIPIQGKTRMSYRYPEAHTIRNPVDEWKIP
jgi:hypothetical protein